MKKMLMALSLSGALLGGSAVVWAEDAASTPVAAEQTMAATDTAAATPETVVTEAPAIEEATPAAEAAPTVDTGDTAWILVSPALVVWFTNPGLTLF